MTKEYWDYLWEYAKATNKMKMPVEKVVKTAFRDIETEQASSWEEVDLPWTEE